MIKEEHLEKMTVKEKELVAVGASVASGCVPCTRYHLKAVRKAGADEADIRQAIDAALHLRRSATQFMTHVATDDEKTVELSGWTARSVLDELVAIAAAFAINSVADLENHLMQARDLGATDRQLQTTLGVARMVKRVAGQKVDRVVQDISEPDQAEADDGGCGCGGDAEQPAQNHSQADDTGCGCDEDAVPAEQDAVPCGCGE